MKWIIFSVFILVEISLSTFLFIGLKKYRKAGGE